MGRRRSFVDVAAGFLFEYNTVKMVHVRSRAVGSWRRTVQLAVVSYVVGWVLVHRKGYQSFDTGVSSVTSKVKGVHRVVAVAGVEPAIWDTADYVVPPHQNGAFFVVTNFVLTRGQTQGRCAEHPSVSGAACLTDADCPADEPLQLGSGVSTGRCVDWVRGDVASASISSPTSDNSSRHRDGDSGFGSAARPARVCEVQAWCPVEDDSVVHRRPALLEGSAAFTVFVRNQVYFPTFDRHQSNVLPSTDLRTCRYHPVADPYCPVFRLRDIVESIPGENYTELARTGGVVSMRVRWDCDYDRDTWGSGDSGGDNCAPTYTFERLDAAPPHGYNFRMAHHYVEGGVPRRDLLKAYGLLCVVSVTARARAFNVVPLLLNLSSGMAMMSLAPLLSDLVLLFFHRRRRQYRRAVFELVRRASLATTRMRNGGRGRDRGGSGGGGGDGGAGCGDGGGNGGGDADGVVTREPVGESIRS